MDISCAHQAVSANNLQCLKVVLRKGADITTKDKRGLTPLDVAKVYLMLLLFAIYKKDNIFQGSTNIFVMVA